MELCYGPAMPSPGKGAAAKYVACGLYEPELTIVQAVMNKYGMTLSAAIRFLIRHGAIALDMDPNQTR